MLDWPHEEAGKKCHFQNPCNLKILQNPATQMGISAHSVRPQDCVDTEDTAAKLTKQHFTKVTAIIRTQIIP